MMRSPNPVVRRVRSLAASLLVIGFGVQGALAQLPTTLPRQDSWSPDGPAPIARIVGTTLYFGGSFTQVGPFTGAFAAVDSTTGILAPTFPIVDGPVRGIAPDGVGGWFIVGTFVRVNNQSRLGMAHILANGLLDGWNPGTGGQGWCVAVAGNTVYAGFEGSSGLFAFNALTGAPVGVNLTVNGPVFALATNGNTLYVAGSFTTIAGSPRQSLAAVDVTTNTVVPWLSNVNGSITSATLAGADLYIGGNFSTVAGQPRTNLAFVSGTTGVPTAFNPAPNNTVTSMGLSGTTLYLGGRFTQIGATARTAAAAVDSTSGALLPWNPVLLSGVNPAEVNAVAVRGTEVLLGGFFAKANATARASFATVDAATATLLAWNPACSTGVNGTTINSIVVAGGQTAIGGNFLITGGQPRPSAAAMDLNTGQLLPWQPAFVPPVNLWPLVQSMAATSTRIHISGRYNSGSNSEGIQFTNAYNPTSGALDNNFVAFDTHASSAMAIADGVLCYYNPGSTGGRAIDGFDAATGDLLWTRAQSAAVTAFAASDVTHCLYVSAGSSLFALRLTDGVQQGPTVVADQGITTLAAVGRRVYLGGDFNQLGGTPRTKVASIDYSPTMQPLLTSWNPQVSDSVSSVAANTGRVYMSGSFNTVAGRFLPRLAGLNADSPAACTWNPAGALAGVVVLGPSHLVSHGNTMRFGNRPFQGLAIFPIVPCTADADANCILNANDFQVFLGLFAAGDQAANCDGSTIPPVLTANDFTCFLNSYASGCP